MKILVWLVGLGGITAFFVSVIIRVMNQGSILKASATGWWRSSVVLMAIAIFLVVIEIRNGLLKLPSDSAK